MMKVERWRSSTKPTNSLRNYPRQTVHPTTRFYHTTLTRFALHTSLPQYKLHTSSTSPFLNLHITNFWRSYARAKEDVKKIKSSAKDTKTDKKKDKTEKTTKAKAQKAESEKKTKSSKSSEEKTSKSTKKTKESKEEKSTKKSKAAKDTEEKTPSTKKAKESKGKAKEPKATKEVKEAKSPKESKTKGSKTKEEEPKEKVEKKTKEVSQKKKADKPAPAVVTGRSVVIDVPPKPAAAPYTPPSSPVKITAVKIKTKEKSKNDTKIQDTPIRFPLPVALGGPGPRPTPAFKPASAPYRPPDSTAKKIPQEYVPPPPQFETSATEVQKVEKKKPKPFIPPPPPSSEVGASANAVKKEEKVPEALIRPKKTTPSGVYRPQAQKEKEKVFTPFKFPTASPTDPLPSTPRFRSIDSSKEAIKIDSPAGEYNKKIWDQTQTKKFHDALQTYQEMMSKGLERNMMTFNLVMKCYKNLLQIQNMFDLVAEMKSIGAKPGEAIFTYIITALAEQGDTDAMMEWFEKMKEAEIPPGVKALSAMAIAFESRGDIDNMGKIFQLLQEAMPEGVVLPVPDGSKDFIKKMLVIERRKYNERHKEIHCECFKPAKEEISSQVHSDGKPFFLCATDVCGFFRWWSPKMPLRLIQTPPNPNSPPKDSSSSPSTPSTPDATSASNS